MLLLIFRAHSKLKDVFTLPDIDTLFDDIGNYIVTFTSLLSHFFHAIHCVKPYSMLLLLVDADSELGLPLLPPLPKSTGVNGQKKSSCDPKKMKASSKKVRMD